VGNGKKPRELRKGLDSAVGESNISKTKKKYPMHKLCVRKTAERPSFANSKLKEHTQNMIVEEQLNTTKDS
jgi:hypothetical protein